MRILKTAAVLTVSALAAACGGGASAGSKPTTLRLGYFPNVTHAGAVYGVASGIYAETLGTTKLTTQTFNAGPAEVEALLGNAIDAAYIGPGPALNAFIRSKGAVVIVAGATSGGASLVVRPGVTDLKGLKIADPQTGGTQDIALRAYLASKGLKVDKQGGGDVTILSQENAQTLDLFKAGKVDGAWVPEPWASRLVLEGGGTVLVDEKSLWPGGKFVTTNLLVRNEFLKKHPEAVKALIEAQVAADKQITAHPDEAQTVVNAALKQLTGKSLKPEVIARAFSQITVGEDPLAATLKVEAEHAFATGLVKRGDLKGIYRLRLLREVLGTVVDDAGLGKD
ncbi:MAG: ABC transporter substrate-binding protein [Actinomycetota bacterium]|nr:ABC transporter substrate-binding protein [Actinomycetota bacterium]